MTDTAKPVLTDVQYIKKMVDLIVQTDAINDGLKEVKSEAKEAGFDAALLGTVAKAIAAAKESELTEKSEAIIALLGKV